MITGIAKRVNKTPAQVLLAWALQRGTAPLTTATSKGHIEENFDVSALPDDAIEEITQGIGTRVRLIRLLTRASRGSFPGEDERSSRNFPLSCGLRSSQSFLLNRHPCQFCAALDLNGRLEKDGSAGGPLLQLTETGEQYIATGRSVLAERDEAKLFAVG